MRERRSRATEDARDSPSFWLSKLKHEYETEAHTYRDYQNYRHVFKMLNCRSAVVDWQQTRSDFDVTSTMLKFIANAMYIFWNYVYERELQIVNKISEIEPGTSVCHFTLNRGLNRFWRAHTRGTTYTPTHTHSHISCGVTSPAHASQGGSFSTLASATFRNLHWIARSHWRARLFGTYTGCACQLGFS